MNNTIERLCDNLINLNDNEINILNNNYINEVKNLFADEPIAIFDDSEIYSCKSNVFFSMNNYTKDSIDTVRNVVKRKVKMTLWFDDNEKYDVCISHTKVTLSYNKKIMKK